MSGQPVPWGALALAETRVRVVCYGAVGGVFHVNRPGMSGDLSALELSGLLVSDLSVVSSFHLGGRDVAAVLVEAAVVEPVDPFGGGQLDVIDVVPGSLLLDQLGLVEAVDRLGQRVVVRRPDDPTAPTEGRMPDSASRSPRARDVYCDPWS